MALRNRAKAAPHLTKPKLHSIYALSHPKPIHELFTERMCISFRLTPFSRAYGSRYFSISSEVLFQNVANEVMLMWDRHYFAVHVNGCVLGPVRLGTDVAPGPPSQACPYVWTVSAKRGARRQNLVLTPMLSPIMPGAECTCRLCEEPHVLEQHGCVVCPVCSSWVGV